ncbi:MAG TPA: hypothetical protein VFM65_04510 [Flavobacteriaceae bacterium]|nr:hypothetical protein [Flavobacteriaceae bacterium]
MSWQQYETNRNNMKNEQKQYKFLEASWILMLITFICGMILNIILVSKIPNYIEIPKNGITGISAVILIFIVPIVLSRVVSFSKTTVTLNKKEIQVNRSSIIGLPIKPDLILPYSQISSYVFQNDQNWYWLKIKDSNGKVYRIWKFAHYKNKEFRAFRDRLTNEINWFNQENTNTDNVEPREEYIKLAGNIYQGTSGIILGVISLIFIIAIPIIFMTFGVPNLRSLGPGLIGLSGAIFTFIKVLYERKKRNTVANNGYKK